MTSLQGIQVLVSPQGIQVLVSPQGIPGFINPPVTDPVSNALPVDHPAV
jgi:hypothetical protein